MLFALLGDHLDGLDFARALTASGRHELAIYSGPPAGLEHLRRHGLSPRAIGDLEEVLADPAVEAVIVASSLTVRRHQLVRALRSECHVLCVHPADISPDAAYEASMIQADTGRVLLPLLPMALHPGVARLRELARSAESAVRLVEMEIWSNEEVLLEADAANHKPGLPGWDVLRAIGGEIGEVYLQSTSAALEANQPFLITGRFLNGMLIQSTYLPGQAESRIRVAIVTTTGGADLEFAGGWPGPGLFTFVDEHGERRTEPCADFHPWEPLIERFEQAVVEAGIRRPPLAQPPKECLTTVPALLGWEDELRALELDDGSRRSLERGRSSTLDLQETTEEASFKGTMTLVGCSLIWLAVVALILSFWIPWLALGIVPVFGFFLVLQALRWVLPEKSGPAA